MDTTTNQGKKVDSTNRTELMEVGIEFNVKIPPERRAEYNEIVKHVMRIHEEQTVAIDKASKSFWSDKRYLELAGFISELYVGSSISLWTLMYALDYVETRLENVEKIVQGITERLNVDLPNLKVEMENLKTAVNAPAIVRANTWIQAMDKAMEKIDKNRKNVLRDSVV